MRTSPLRGRVLRCAVIAACAATAAVLAPHTLLPVSFRDLLPNSNSNVGLQRVLRDHGVILPRSTRNLRYIANKYTEDDH